MAIAVQAFAACLVRCGTGAAGALEDLGYGRNGVNWTDEAFWSNVHGDQNGGDEGPPIEVQYLGQTARIRMELTKFDATVADKLAVRVLAATVGQPATPGTLMFASTKYVRILLTNATNSGPINFPQCIIRNAIEINKGTKFSTLVIEAEAHKNASGVLFNSTYA